MVAALVSLYVDQSFAGAFGAISNYAGGALGSRANEMPWIFIGYNALYYAIILLTPWSIDRFGRRAVFSTGHVAFAVITFYSAGTSSLHGHAWVAALKNSRKERFSFAPWRRC